MNVRSRLAALGVAAGVASAALVTGPAIVSPETAPQAQAAYESVDNHWRSTKSISVRIWDAPNTLNYIVAPDSGVAAGNDRLVSWLLPARTCADVQGDVSGFRTVRAYGTAVRFNIAMEDNLLIRTWAC